MSFFKYDDICYKNNDDYEEIKKIIFVSPNINKATRYGVYTGNTYFLNSSTTLEVGDLIKIRRNCDDKNVSLISVSYPKTTKKIIERLINVLIFYLEKYHDIYVKYDTIDNKFIIKNIDAKIFNDNNLYYNPLYICMQTYFKFETNINEFIKSKIDISELINKSNKPLFDKLNNKYGSELMNYIESNNIDTSDIKHKYKCIEYTLNEIYQKYNKIQEKVKNNVIIEIFEQLYMTVKNLVDEYGENVFYFLRGPNTTDILDPFKQIILCSFLKYEETRFDKNVNDLKIFFSNKYNLSFSDDIYVDILNTIEDEFKFNPEYHNKKIDDLCLSKILCFADVLQTDEIIKIINENNNFEKCVIDFLNYITTKTNPSNYIKSRKIKLFEIFNNYNCTYAKNCLEVLLLILQNQHVCYPIYLIEKKYDVQYLINKGLFVNYDNKFCYPIKLYEEEEYISMRIKNMSYETITVQNLNEQLYLCSSPELIFNDEQINGIKNCFLKKISIMNGCPGTGKSTCIKTITKIAQKMGLSVFILAPTGIAAYRIKKEFNIINKNDDCENFETKIIEKYTKIDCETIHYFLYTKKCPINNKNCMFIIDETSMMDNHLFYLLLKKIEICYSITFIGDTNQLNPINYGLPLMQMCDCEQIPKTTLMKQNRQKENSALHKTIENIKNNTNEIIEGPDLIICETDNIKTELMNILKMCKNIRLNFHKVMILTYKNKTISAHEECVRKFILNDVEMEKNKFSVGDHVVVTKNYYKTDDDEMKFYNDNFGEVIKQNNIFNGMRGRIVDICKLENKKTKIEQKYKIKFYEGEENYVNVSILKKAYIQTIHKAQGSQAKIIIILIDNDDVNLNKNLIYTALSRTVDKCFVVGNISNFKKTLNYKQDDRFSNINDMILNE